MKKGKILFLADYVLPFPGGGAGISAISEARLLANSGWDVTIASRQSITRGCCNKLFKKNISELSPLNYIHIDQINSRYNYSVIIFNNISLAPTVEHIKKHTDSLLIFRKHIDWLKKIEVSRKTGMSVNRLFRLYKRHSPSKTVSLYNRSLAVCDVIFDVHPSSAKINLSTLFVKPLSFPINSIPTNRRAKPFSILIGGRLEDPLKGDHRIIDTLKNLSLRTFDVHLMGNATCRFKTNLKSVVKGKIYDYGWVRNPKKRGYIYQSCDVFLTLPFYEPYGLMVEEALLSEMHVVSTNDGLASILHNKGCHLVWIVEQNQCTSKLACEYLHEIEANKGRVTKTDLSGLTISMPTIERTLDELVINNEKKISIFC
nr:glycosyltransferase [uncultured Desulfobacter sp.]